MRKLFPYSLLIVICMFCSFADKGVMVSASNCPMDFSFDEKLIDNRITHFFPNPATTVIHFTFEKSTDKIASLQIYNFIGRKMTEQKIVNNKLTIQLDDQYFRGLYIYQLIDINGRIIESGKFQVSK